MNAQIFNGCLLVAWFLLTLGGILWNPAAGLLIGGVALLVLTAGIALRFGVRAGAELHAIREGKSGSEAR